MPVDLRATGAAPMPFARRWFPPPTSLPRQNTRRQIRRARAHAPRQREPLPASQKPVCMRRIQLALAARRPTTRAPLRQPTDHSSAARATLAALRVAQAFLLALIREWPAPVSPLPRFASKPLIERYAG